MTLVKWALPQLSELLPLDEESLKEIILYTNTLSDAEATIHLTGLLGDAPKAAEFITSFNAHRSAVTAEKSKLSSDVKGTPPANAPPAYAPPAYPVVSQNTSMLLGRPHMNRVIEAANVRARDEVCLILSGPRQLTNIPTARDAVCATEPPIAIWDLQQRDRTRA